ncbi:hypothetical protein QUB61_31570 [Microcoleus sp. C2D2]
MISSDRICLKIDRREPFSLLTGKSVAKLIPFEIFDLGVRGSAIAIADPSSRAPVERL